MLQAKAGEKSTIESRIYRFTRSIFIEIDPHPDLYKNAIELLDVLNWPRLGFLRFSCDKPLALKKLIIARVQRKRLKTVGVFVGTSCA